MHPGPVGDQGEGVRPAWDDKSVTGGDPADTAFKYGGLNYSNEGSTVMTFNVSWSVEDSSLRQISMTVRNTGSVDIEAVRNAVLSDALMEGMEAFREKLFTQEAWKSIGETVAHSADGYVLRESGFTGIYQLVLTNAGADLHKDGHFIYSADGGEAAVCGLVEDDGLPQNLIIPESLGGCPVKTVSFTFIIAENVSSGQRAVAIPKTAETVVMDNALPAIFILPETVKTLSFPNTVPIQASAPTIMCTGRETKLEAGPFIEGVVSFTGRKPTVLAFFGSELAEYAREHEWNVSLLDDMEDGDPQDPEAREQLEKLKAGDYSVLENAWKFSSD